MAGEKDKFSEQQIGEATKALYAAMIKPREPSTVSERQPTSLSETIAPVSIRVSGSGDNIEAIVSNFATAANKIIDANKNVVTPVSRSIAAPVNIIDLRGYSVNSPNYTSLVSRNFNALRGKVDNLGYELSKKVSEVRKLETAIRARESNLITAQMTMAKNLSKNVEGHVSKLKEEIRDLQKQLQFRRRQDSDQKSQDRVEERTYQRSRYDDEEEEGRGRGRRHGFGLGAIAGIGSRLRGVTKVAEAAGEVLGAASLVGLGYFLIKSGIGEKIVSQVLPNVIKAVTPKIKEEAESLVSGAYKWVKDDLAGRHKALNAEVQKGQEEIQKLLNKGTSMILNWLNEPMSEKIKDVRGAAKWLGGEGSISDSYVAQKFREIDKKIGEFHKANPLGAPTRYNAYYNTQAHKNDPMRAKLETMIKSYQKEGVTPPAHIIAQYNKLTNEGNKNLDKASPNTLQLPSITVREHFNHKGLDRFYNTKKTIERNQRLKRSAINMMVPGTTFGSPASTLNGDDMDGPLSFKNWIEGPTPWGNVIPDIAGAMGGNANSRAGGGGGFFNSRGGGGATGPVPITKPEVPTLPKINTGPGHVVSANPLSPGKIDSTQLFKSYVAEFSKSKLNGYIPKDGAKFGITTGKPEEWARFALAESMQESGLNSYASNGGLNQFNTGDLRRYHVTGNVNDPNAQVKALVNQFSSSIPKAGFIRGPNNTGAAAYFGPVRRSSFDASFNSTSELSKHYKAANEVYTNVGDMTGQKSFAMSPSSAKVFGVSSRNKQFVDMIESYRNQNKAYAEQSGGDNMSYMAGDTRAKQVAFGMQRTINPNTMTSDLSPKIIAEARRVAQQSGGNPAAVSAYMASKGHPKDGAWCAEFGQAVIAGALGQEGLEQHMVPNRSGRNMASSWRGAKNSIRVKNPEPGDIAIRDTHYHSGRGVATGSSGSHFGFVDKVDKNGRVVSLISGNGGQSLYNSEYGDSYSYYRLLGPGVDKKTARVLQGANYRAWLKTHRPEEFDLKAHKIDAEDPIGIAGGRDPKYKEPPTPLDIANEKLRATSMHDALNKGRELAKAARGGAYAGGGIEDTRETRKLETMPGVKRYLNLGKMVPDPRAMINRNGAMQAGTSFVHPSVLSQVQSQVSDIHQSTAVKNLHTQLDVNGAIRSKGSDLAPKAKPKSPVPDPKAGGYHDKNVQTNTNGAIRDRVKPAGGTQNAKQDVRMPRSDSADTSPPGPGENGTGAMDSICFV